MTSFYIETYGYGHTLAESEQMAGLLAKAKFEMKEKLEDADIIIFNTCIIKDPTDSFFTKLETIKKNNPYKIIIVAGCIPQIEPERLKNFTLVGPRQIHHIVEAVEETLHNNIVKMLEVGEIPPLNLPKIRKNPFIELLPINNGCLNASAFSISAFSKTKQAWENVKSYPLQDIVAQARKAVQEGVKEIWLISDDTACYGVDIGTNLVLLLKELIAISGKFKIKVGAGNPFHLRKLKDELFPLFLDDKIYKCMHIPIGSGSNRVLQDMQQGNTREEFISLVQELRSVVPLITVATDIIIGYPTESEDDHWQTMNLLRETMPEVVNILRYWAQRKTPAAGLKQHPVEIVKHRTQVITEIVQNISKIKNEQWIGWEGDIIINEKGTQEKQWLGRNANYKQVLVEENVEQNFKVGDELRVRITRAGMFDLRAQVL